MYLLTSVKAAHLRVLLVLLFLFAAAGCASDRGGIKRTEEAYQDALNRWTRSRKIYDELESRLYIYATYKTQEFRRAYVERYARSYQLEDAHRKSLLEREEDESERYNEFFMTAFTPEARWNDFDKKDSVWKIYLEDSSGARVVPLSITKVDRSDPVIRELFPYFDPWSSGYIIKFPKYSEAGTEPIPSGNTAFIRLTVTGVLGKGELEWRLRK